MSLDAPYRRTLITAHAGAEHTADNTLDSLQVLMHCGCDIVELDLRAYEGRLVLCHDTPHPGTSCADFAQALALLMQVPDVRLNVDVKQPGVLPLAWEAACTLKVQERLVFTGDVGEADVAYAKEKGVPLWYNYYLLPRDRWTNAPREALDRGFIALNIDQRALDAVVDSDCLDLSVWTVNDPDKLRELMKKGVMNITTREPLLALGLRREIEEENSR